MANSLGTISAAVIAQESLPLLVAKFPLLSKVSTSFTAEPVFWGQAVKTRILGGGTVQDYDPVNGYMPADVSDTDVTVTINKHKHDTIGFNDQELSSTGLNLIGEHAEALALKLGNQIMADIAANFVAFAYGAGAQTLVVSAANANRNTLITAGNQALDQRNVSSDRFAIFNPAYIAGLYADSSVIPLTWGGLGVSANTLPVIQGVTVNEYSAMPGNSINLAGVMGAKDSIALATRVPAVPSGQVPINGSITNVTDPESGLSMQAREWYDVQKGKLFFTFTIMYGTAVGNSNSLELFVTA